MFATVSRIFKKYFDSRNVEDTLTETTSVMREKIIVHD